MGSQGSGWVCLPILGVKENVALLAASAKEKKPRDGVDMLPRTVANVEMANPRSKQEREGIKKVEWRWASGTPVCCSA